MNPLKLAKSASWNSVLFTTYSLSLSFFEAVVIDALIRGGARNPMILSDPEGVRAGLSELGARLVGRDYELLPVERIGGVFHPKLSVFLGSERGVRNPTILVLERLAIALEVPAEELLREPPEGS